MKQVEAPSGILPPWHLIKNETITTYYSCVRKLETFRKLPLTKKTSSELAEAKAKIWTEFISEMISLYQMSKFMILDYKNNSDYTALKALDKYALEISNLKYREAITLFNLLGEALHKIGLMNIAKEDEEDEDKVLGI